MGSQFLSGTRVQHTRDFRTGTVVLGAWQGIGYRFITWDGGDTEEVETSLLIEI